MLYHHPGTPRIVALLLLVLVVCPQTCSICFGVETPDVKAPDAQQGDWAQRILADPGVQGGLIVVLGCEEPEMIAELGTRDSYLVQGLDANQENVEKARAVLRSRNLAGKVSVAFWDGKHLPLIDGAVNLLIAKRAVVEGYNSVSAEEILRVLAPLGVARVGDKNVVKPRPEGIDSWTHHMYDSTGIGAGNDRVLGLPRHLQWKAGPEYSRSHENMSSVSVVVSDGGRVFSIMDEGPKASIYLPSQWFLAARDAFSGVLLWKVPIKDWHAKLFPLKSGPLQMTRRLVAAGDRVYVTLGLDSPVSQLDAATGKILTTYSDTQHAEELLCADGKLVVVGNNEEVTAPFTGRMPAGRPDYFGEERTIRTTAERSVTVIDTDQGRTLWTQNCGQVVPLTISADAQVTCFMSGGMLNCLELATGKTVWSRSLADKAPRVGTAHAPTLLLHEEIVYVALGGTLRALDIKKGEELWSAPCAQAGYRTQTAIFIINNLIWDIDVGGEPFRPGSKLISRDYIGFDLRTGEVRKRITMTKDQGYGVMHHRCHIPRASGDYILTGFPGIEFIDVNTGASKHHSWIRGACLYGFMPANGLIYTPPHPCACYMQGKLSGFLAVAPARSEIEKGSKHDPGHAPVRRETRLSKGPAHGQARASESDSKGDWPTYRGDAARRGRASTRLSPTLNEAWTKQLDGTLTQPVIADGRLFTASIHEHVLHAIDADQGELLWSREFGGRIDSAPTCYQGTVLFGCRDGYVYCLRAADGALIWRFLAAPKDRRCVSRDQVESVWPVHGSVLLQDEVLWFVAGRSSFLDGGLYVYRLDPDSGKQLSMTKVLMIDPDGKQPPIDAESIATRLDMAGARPDVLSCDGGHVFMRHYAFDLTGKSVEQNINHLFSTTGFLDDSWFRRTYWIYGNIYVGGAQGWARTGNTRPSGRIMSIGKDHLYGFGRDRYPPSPGNRDQMYATGERERFFATRIPEPGDVQTINIETGGIKAKPQKGGTTKPDAYQWSIPGDLQVRAMLLDHDEKTLFVAGAKGDWIISQDAYEGKQGVTLRAMSTSDGKTLAEYKLPAQPVFDGLSAASGNLYMALTDGSIRCYRADK